jgi:enoyl-CoA hydratase/carnithine racemase
MDAPHARITEDRKGVITVTIDREAKRNAISPQVTDLFWKAARELADRDDLRAMVLTATGSYFTAGIDIAADAANKRGNPETKHLHPGWNYRRNYRDHHLLYDEFEAIEKPIILAAQNTILGAGVEMAMSCDFRFCTPATEWGVPEINLGVIAGSGGSSRLTRLVGPHWAKWMAMAGMRVGADQAKTIGLVHEVFPAETFLQDVYAFCDRLIELPTEAVGLAKQAIDLAADNMDRNAQRYLDRLVNTTLVGSPEHERRTSRFKK